MAGAMIAIHAAAAAQKRTRTVDAFRLHDATAFARARPLPELGLAPDDATLRELVERGVVRGVDSRGRMAIVGDPMSRVERFYLDEEAFVAYRDGGASRVSNRVGALMLVAMALALIGAALLVRLARG